MAVGGWWGNKCKVPLRYFVRVTEIGKIRIEEFIFYVQECRMKVDIDSTS